MQHLKQNIHCSLFFDHVSFLHLSFQPSSVEIYHRLSNEWMRCLNRKNSHDPLNKTDNNFLGKLDVQRSKGKPIAISEPHNVITVNVIRFQKPRLLEIKHHRLLFFGWLM